MEKSLTMILLVSCLLFISPCLAQTQTCSSYTFSNNRNFSTCTDLPRLNSFLHWTYDPFTMLAEIAFRKTGASTGNWIAWAINPNSNRMAGSQALVAYQHSNGSMIAYTTPLSGTPDMQPGSLSFGVPTISSEHVGPDMIIFATLQLNNNLVSTNQLWQEGPLRNGAPAGHVLGGDNMNSISMVNFQSGVVTRTGGGGASSVARKRNIHGILNGLSWGILMPVGVMTARYLKVFNAPGAAWFYIHVGCQSSAYVLGVAGWATGLKLGSDSPGITYTKHRNIGITLFCLATLQVFALLLRPKPDHKYRFYWNLYHHSIGYATIALSIANIYQGFEALNREDEWKKAYTGIIICLGAIALVLEVLTWIIVLKKKKAERSVKHVNGANGNGYSNRSQQHV